MIHKSRCVNAELLPCSGAACCASVSTTSKVKSYSRNLPLALFFHLLDLALDQVALKHAEVLQKQNPVQMIDFMAKSPRQKILSANLKRFALGILRPYSHELRSHHIPAKSRNRETPFFLANFPFGMNNFRIGKHDLRLGIFPTRHVHHGEPHALPDLRRRQSHSRRGVHRSKHILGECFKLRIKFLHRRSRLFKYRIAVLYDRIDFSRGRRNRGLNSRWSRARGRFRTLRFVWHSCRNSAASPKGNLLQIFAEKHPPAQVRSSLRRPPRLPERRTNPSARKRPQQAPSSPCPRYAA